MIKNKKAGFTLIEVLVVLSILSVFLLSAISISIVTVRNLKSSEDKILATRYAEELKEWLRGEKEANWDNFISMKAGDWCFDQEPITGWQKYHVCGDNEIITNTTFKRDVNITPDAIETSRIIISIKVSWTEGSGNETITVPINTVFEKYK